MSPDRIGTSSDDQTAINLFNHVPDQGQLDDLEMYYNVPIIDIKTHIQGMVMSPYGWMFSHNERKEGENGYLLIYQGYEPKEAVKFDIVCGGYAHPGGLGYSRNLLAVPVEPDENGQGKSVIQFYDAGNDWFSPQLLPFNIDRPSSGAGCAALALFGEKFVLVVYTSSTFDVYASNGIDFHDANFQFEFLFTSNIPDGYDNISPFIVEDKLYILGLTEFENKTNWTDYMSLYRIDLDLQSTPFLAGPRHMYTHGGNVGKLKPSFRFGATIDWLPDGIGIVVYCTERSTHELGKFSLNRFEAPSGAH